MYKGTKTNEDIQNGDKKRKKGKDEGGRKKGQKMAKFTRPYPTNYNLGQRTRKHEHTLKQEGREGRKGKYGGRE